MNETILQSLRDFSIDNYYPIVKRDLDLGQPFKPKVGNLVKVVKGMRRSGKSYRLFQEMDALHNSGVPWSQICYFNFEDDRLRPITSKTGDEVIEAFTFLHPEATQGVYFFFDELQEMQDWGSWLRRIVDTKKATIYVSGSSSQMLSSEISTDFRGRAIDFELLPCSFKESLRFSQEFVETNQNTYTTEEKLKLTGAFEAYLECGGFPSVQQLPRSQRIALLQSYAQRVVARDVVERHNLSRPRVASAFATRILASNARELSIRKVENDFRSVGLATSRGFMRDLLAHFEEAYLVFTVRELSRALSETSTAPQKVYAIDPGLALANSRASSTDEGQRLENAVYLELRRRLVGMRKDEISSYKTKLHGFEIDFVARDALAGNLELCQVSVSVENEKTLQRETRALWEAMGELHVSEAKLIVEKGKHAEYQQGKKRIVQIPAWKWFLETS